ncbi:amidohydrolase [Psychromonas sp. CD1]|uniref:amidohydrolase n=1 Tax=Psychromonas sp. CD1 TaxID=1979839 RepID=UPI000B9AAECC|nr:amidohydrolase [Psychromonas sp. CD1]
MNFKDLSLRLIDYDAEVTVFKAKKVITMNNKHPQAEAVAVQNGIIVGVGDFSNIIQLLYINKIKVICNQQFSEHIIYPGFSEHHMHPQILGSYLKHSHYIGYLDRVDEKGNILPGIQSKGALLARLQVLIRQDNERLEQGDAHWLNCWGLDPLLLGNVDLSCKILDKISDKYPICLAHASGHVININSYAIDLCAYQVLADDPNLERDIKGVVTGTIAEMPMIQHAILKGAMRMDYTIEGLVDASRIATKIARINGCTSITDKGTNFPFIPKDNASQGWIEAKERGLLSTRVNMEVWYSTIEHWRYAGKTGWPAIHALKNKKDNFLSVGNLKFIMDGSIQGFTANMLPDQPYVTEHKKNGILLMSCAQAIEQLKISETHGFSCSIHTNGNGAIETALLAIENVRQASSNIGFRHSLEHCQLATENQFYRMKKYDVTPNLFANHIYFWGDVHVKYTVGEHIARRMNACRSATDHGLLHGLHSDDMVTEVAPLFSAWCAVNRRTLSGRVLGEDQCLSVAEAMRVITYNHAWLAHQDDVRGSIEIGKWADFTILEEEATEDAAIYLKDIKIVATVINGDDIFIN